MQPHEVTRRHCLTVAIVSVSANGRWGWKKGVGLKKCLELVPCGELDLSTIVGADIPRWLADQWQSHIFFKRGIRVQLSRASRQDGQEGQGKASSG